MYYLFHPWQSQRVYSIDSRVRTYPHAFHPGIIMVYFRLECIRSRRLSSTERHTYILVLVYTDFFSMVRQVPTMKKLLPLEVGEEGKGRVQDYAAIERGPSAAYIYEPGQLEILDEIIPRFSALQVYQAILESLASEHAARMVAMRNATESATELADALQLEYNKVRQQNITNEILDIVGGAEAQVQA